MKILKHIFRVLSAHTGPFQGLNMIATDCQNCINNFHFDLFDTIFYKKDLQVYGGLTQQFDVLQHLQQDLVDI